MFKIIFLLSSLLIHNTLYAYDDAASIYSALDTSYAAKNYSSKKSTEARCNAKNRLISYISSKFSGGESIELVEYRNKLWTKTATGNSEADLISLLVERGMFSFEREKWLANCYKGNDDFAERMQEASLIGTCEAKRRWAEIGGRQAVRGEYFKSEESPERKIRALSNDEVYNAMSAGYDLIKKNGVDFLSNIGDAVVTTCISEQREKNLQRGISRLK